MGCSVEYSICSVCHKKAHTSDEYCDCVANRKNRKFSGDKKCEYHNSPGELEDKCPLCGSTKGNVKSNVFSGQLIYEHNYGLKFIENSFVVNPACHDCGVRCILHAPEVESKVASLSKMVNSLYKDANSPHEKEGLIDKAVKKVGGMNELNNLKESMDKLQNVVQSMFKQQQQVSMEYVSDISKVMADIEGIYDELNEMGYGAVPSPDITMADSDMGETQPFPDPVPAPDPIPQGSGSSQNTEMSGLGSITKPANSEKKIKEFFVRNVNLINKLSSNGNKVMSDSIVEVSSDSSPLHKIIICKTTDDDIVVATVDGDSILNTYNISEFSDETQSLIRTSPEDAGHFLLNDNFKEIGAKMATKNTKTAASDANQEVVTEKQLEKKEESLHPRTEEVYEGVTESKEQIGGTEKSNDTTSDSPQVRLGTYETTTEDQLETVSAELVRFDNTPEVITEKQWTDFSKTIGSKVADGYTEQITEQQICDLLSNHQFVGTYETTTEDQLKNLSMTDGLKRWASKNYVKSLMKTATQAISDTVVKYKKDINTVSKAASIIVDNDQIKAKASYLAIINSLPHKRQALKSLLSDSSYIKTASVNKYSPADALVIAVAENAQLGQKAEDVFDYVSQVFTNKVAMAKVNEIITFKIAKVKEETKIANRYDAFANNMSEFKKAEDGKYRIKATLKDITVATKTAKGLGEGVQKFAQEFLDEEIGGGEVASAVINIEATPDGQLVIDIQDGSNDSMEAEDIGEEIGEAIEGPIEDMDFENIDENELEPDGPEDIDGGEDIDDEEDIDDGGGEKLDDFSSSSPMPGAENAVIASARNEIVKKAQMMGGEMGGQGGMGQGAGAGATMPMAPGAPEAAPMESFTDEGGMGEEDGMGEEGLEALPPGSVCPVCTSSDVDIIGGKGRCNNCGSEMQFKVEVEVTRWKGLTPEDGEEGEGFEGAAAGEEGFEGEGFEMPEEPAVAAMTKIKPEAIQKLASQDIKLGSVSPATGTTNTVDIGGGNHICLDTGTKYKVSYVVDKKDKSIWGQWEWKPVNSKQVCASCSRAKQKFVEALSTINMTQDEFDTLARTDMTKTTQIIKQLQEAGSFKEVKTAAKNSSIMKEYKVAFGGYGDSFPIESCIEKLARRFGENALALSGPCEGKPLADCVCNQLKKADVYTDKLAVKIASTWSDCDGDKECITHQVRAGYGLDDAVSICGTLKTAVISNDHLFADKLAQVIEEEESMIDDGIEEDPMIDEGIGDVDPFADAEEGLDGAGTVTIELPVDVAEQLSDAVETATGGDVIDEAPIDGEIGAEPGLEENIDEAPIDGEIGAEPGLEDNIEGSPLDDMSPATGIPEEGGAVLEENLENQGLEEGISGGNVNITVNGQPMGSEMGSEMEQFAGNEYDYKEAANMKSTIGETGVIHLDLAAVAQSLVKEAGEKEIQQEKMQDSSDIGSYTAGDTGSLMGHENETIETAKAPSIPRDKSLMGDEAQDLNPQDKPLPKIPSDSGTMGHENEVGLDGGDVRFTGGDQGAGETELTSKASVEDDFDLYHMRGKGTAKEGLARLAERILEKQADKLAPPAPVADDKDIQPISNGGTLGKEDKFTADEPKDTEGSATESLMGHESETVGDAPKSPADHPDIATGNAQMGHEDLDSEKTNKDKGTVIAKTEPESEAYRVAGRMLESRMISASELQTKVNELTAYKPAQIRDFEKSIFASKKGLDTVSDGMSQAVVINEASNVRNSQDELASQLSELFSLEKRNKLADEDPMIQLRRTFGK